jgi:hypothetical protein
MKRDLVNPFATCELRLPAGLVDDVRRYTSTFTAEGGGEPDPDRTPFRRYVDVWWAAIALGASEDKRVENPPGGWHKFIDGVILQSDPWRITQLQMLGLAWLGGPAALAEPAKIVARANEYAAYGLPVLLEVMAGQTEPVWELSHFLRERCSPKVELVAPPELAE